MAGSAQKPWMTSLPWVGIVVVTGVVLTAVATVVARSIVLSPWVLPIGSTVGAAVTGSILLLGLWLGPFRATLGRHAAQLSLRTSLVHVLLSASAYVGLVYRTVAVHQPNVCASQASCTDAEWRGLIATSVAETLALLYGWITFSALLLHVLRTRGGR